jgi:hypothetical protein
MKTFITAAGPSVKWISMCAAVRTVKAVVLYSCALTSSVEIKSVLSLKLIFLMFKQMGGCIILFDSR